MIAFPEMLVPAAVKAGIKVPKNVYDYNKDNYMHFFVFCVMQLGQAMPYFGVHYENAKVIGKLSDKEIKKITPAELKEKGFVDGSTSEFYK